MLIKFSSFKQLINLMRLLSNSEDLFIHLCREDFDNFYEECCASCSSVRLGDNWFSVTEGQAVFVFYLDEYAPPASESIVFGL